MSFKKIVLQLHLWLGLSTGIIVVILGITGCILAFEIDIRNLTEGYKYTAVQSTPYLEPTVLKQFAEQALTSKKALGIEYPGTNKAAVASYYDEKNYEIVYLNPYNGKLQQHSNMKNDFFRFILNGHYYLWLPEKLGNLIVASATLIFLIMLITGLILWWPKNKAAAKQRFIIKWNAKWPRKNYDLHNVAGFYITWVAIFIAITGLVFGFQWFAKSVYWVSSGGKKIVPHTQPFSDTTTHQADTNVVNRLWRQQLATLEAGESISVYFAFLPTDPVEVGINHRPGTYYNSTFIHYDRYSGKALADTGAYSGSFKNASVADKIVRLNYDLHTGAALGIIGKTIAFFASLIAASLPITGFIIWWGKGKRGRKVNKVKKENEAVI